MTENIFTFRPIGMSVWYEYKDKSWALNPSNDYQEFLKQEEKFKDEKNIRQYQVFKIEPVIENNKKYTLVAFPLFFSSESWGTLWTYNYHKNFNNNPQRINLVNKFVRQVKFQNLKTDEVPYFALTSSFSFCEISIGEVNYDEPSATPGVAPTKRSGIRENLTDGMAESDLILIAPLDGYKITQVPANQVPEEENQPEDKQKPDKNNHQCQAVHDKLHDWEIKAKTKVLNDCQNGIHAGIFKAGVFAAPEYAQYTVLTEKCGCGEQLKRNGYGDEMTKCSEECDEEDNQRNNNQAVIQFRNIIKQIILNSLEENNLKILDLPVEFQNWETVLEGLSNKKEIKKFRQKLEKAIQGKKNELKIKQEKNRFSLPVKLLIGSGIVLIFILGLVGFIWFKKRKR